MNDEVGACDLTLDPNNPRIIYASTWRIKRTPYSLESGGEGSGLWKSTDGGESWKNMPLPVEPNSSIWDFAFHPSDPNTILANTLYGELYTSGDGGDSWEKIKREFGEVRAVAWLPNERPVAFRVTGGNTPQYVLMPWRRDYGSHKSQQGQGEA